MKPYYQNELTTIYNGDCLDVMDYLIEQGIKVDAIITDPPYGNMNTDGGKKMGIHEWDIEIEPIKLFNRIDKILRKNGKVILFSQEPYTSKLIKNAIPNIPFNYRAIWEKDNFANPLGANKNMVSFTEDILVFSKNSPIYDYDGKHPLRSYFKNELKKSKLTKKEIKKILNNGMGSHYFTEKEQFCIPTLNNYIKLQTTGYFNEKYENIKKTDDIFRKELQEKLIKQYPSTFNLWQGGKYKSNILKYRKDYNGYHPTQKPILLMEDIIKTFSNENDLILDFTAGSFSTGIACSYTKRQFIGIELEKKYCDIGVKRLNSLQLKFDI